MPRRHHILPYVAIIFCVHFERFHVCMHLLVQSLMGNTWKLKGVKDSTSVETLKLLIYRATGIHPTDQVLFRGSTQLEDVYHVGKYGLADGNTVRLHPKMRSGLWAS